MSSLGAIVLVWVLFFNVCHIFFTSRPKKYQNRDVFNEKPPICVLMARPLKKMSGYLKKKQAYGTNFATRYFDVRGFPFGHDFCIRI